MNSRSTHSPSGVLPAGQSTSGCRLYQLKLIASLLVLIAGMTNAFAQQSNLTCSQTSVPITGPTFGSLSTTLSSGFALPGNAVNSSLTDRTDALVALGGTASLRVTSPNTYLAGNYAGFVIGTGGLNLGVLSNVTLRTYLGGIAQETASSGTMLSVAVGTGQLEVGFYTDKPYDAVEIDFTALALSTFSVYYPVMRGTGSCSSASTTPCNAPVFPRFSNYATVVDPLHTGIAGISTATWSGLDAVTDSDTTNAATLGPLGVSVLSTSTLAVKNTVANFPAGYFAGFEIQNTALLDATLLGNFSVVTYRNDTVLQTVNGANLLLGASVIGNTGRRRIGFVTNQPFDEIQLVITQPVGINLGVTSVFGAVIRNFCAGPALPCNAPYALKERQFPVYVNSAATGFSGAACALCSIDSLSNLLDNDTLNAASITVTGALTTGVIAVRDQLTVYPGGTSYAGFEIQNTALANVNVLSAITVSVYRGGVLKQTSGSANLLVGVPSSLLGPGSGRYNVGFVPDSSFDEIRLNIVQPVGVTLGATFVYSALVQNFCAGPLACRGVTWLNSPAQSVYVDQALTGSSGAACALCTVNNPERAISASTTDFAQLITTASVGASTSLAVRDAITTYPAKTIAGFAFQDPNNILQLNLLQTITLSTYNNGVLQESRSAGSLLNLSLLIVQLNPSTGYYNLAMQTTLPFDEVRISVNPLVGVAPVLNIYGAFVDTRFVDTLNSTTVCVAAPKADPDHLGMPKNTTLTGNLRTNDSDPAGLALSYTPAPAVAPRNGTATINPNGTFSYTPATGFVGLDSFAYTVCNSQNICATAWAYVSVLDNRVANGPNVAQVPQPDRSETLVNTPVTGDAAANDIDVEQRPLTYTVTSNPLHGTLTMTPAGVYVYTPETGYVGMDSAYISVCDTATPQICRTSKLLLMIYPDQGPANDAPFAEDDVAATRRGAAAGGNVLTNDKDPNANPLTATAFGATLPSTTGTFTMAPNGAWTFTPASTFIGTVNIPYAISDGQGGTDTATLSITVVPYIGPDYTPTITIPTPNFPMVGVTRDFRVAISELQNSSNEGPLSFRIIKPSAFTVIYSDTITSVNINGVIPVANANWTFTETGTSIICTMKPGMVMPGFGIQYVGFRLQRRSNIPTNTSQNLTTTITTGSGGDGLQSNNQSSVSVTAQ